MRQVHEENRYNIEALVAASYEAAFDQSNDCSWCAFLSELCDYFGAATGGLVQHDFALQESSLRHKYNTDGWIEIDAGYSLNPVMPDFGDVPGAASNGSSVWPDTAIGPAGRDKQESPGAANAHHLTGLISREVDKITWLCLTRPVNRAAFNPGHHATFEHLLPHFRRSLGLRSALIRDRTSHTTLIDIMDMLPVAMLRVDGKGYVHFKNLAAEELLADEGGIVLRRDGTLAASTSGATEHLRRMISKAADRVCAPSASGARCLVPRGTGRLPLICVLYRVEGNTADPDGRGDPTVAIAIKDPQASVSDGIEAFQAAFGLTKAEARLIGLLLEGRGLFEAAGHLGITKNTVRTHMRNIYGKVGMHRQTDLISMVERFNIF